VSDLLVILNPRQIEECIRAFGELEIDRLWLRNMKEKEIEQRWPEILEAAIGYDRLILVSDDGVVRQWALDAVIELLDEGHPVVTGYSNLDSAAHWRNEHWVNLNRTPLPEYSTTNAYDLYTLGEVFCWPDRVVPTTFCGWCLTGMSYELWERFPYDTAFGSDFNLSRRLARSEIPIVAARDAFVWHVKETSKGPDQETRKGLRVGKELAEIVLETA
jgi:hypothetical protein